MADIEALAPDAAWGKRGAESAAISIAIDGIYNQDVMLHEGAQPFTYRVFLGPVSAGTHTIAVTRNERCSAEGAGIQVKQIQVRSVPPGDPDSTAIAHAPILYARADTLGRFSDLPVLMWYERFPQADGETLQYSVIFTNEDGGTPTDALMARWGHASDIEYVYRVTLDRNGNVRDEIYQAPEHKDLRFAGRKIGQHPLLLVATLNNVFSDSGFSPVRYQMLPFSADLSDSTRESLMDANPWTYRLVHQELEREGKLRPFGAEEGSSISDIRNYLWVDAKLEVRGPSGIAAWVKLKGGEKWRSSHRGRLDLAISRNGMVRTSVELPPGTKAEQVEQISFECVDLRDPRQQPRPSAGECTLQPKSAFFLDARFKPGEKLALPTANITLHSGEQGSVQLGPYF